MGLLLLAKGVISVVMVVLWVGVVVGQSEEKYFSTGDPAPQYPVNKSAGCVAAECMKSYLVTGASDLMFSRYIRDHRYAFEDVILHRKEEDPARRPRAVQFFDWYGCMFKRGSEMFSRLNSGLSRPVHCEEFFEELPMLATGKSSLFNIGTKKKWTMFLRPVLDTPFETGRKLAASFKALESNLPSVIVIAGESLPHVSQLAPSLRYIQNLGKNSPPRIFAEAYDQYVPGVRVMPTGLTANFRSPQPGMNPVHVMDMLADVPRWPVKKRNVIAAWGAMTSELDKIVPSRMAARKWVEGKGSWVNSTMVHRSKWYEHLRDYEFILAPDGAGVQSTKMVEAYLMGTVNIVRRGPAYEDLRRMGYPLVIVDEWDEVTQEKLAGWWEEESPKIPYARWMTVSDMWYSFLTADPFPETIQKFISSFKDRLL